MVCGTVLRAHSLEPIDAITIYDTEALYYMCRHNLDIELPTYMVGSRLHAHHTSWLVPLCFDWALNEDIIDFQESSRSSSTSMLWCSSVQR